MGWCQFAGAVVLNTVYSIQYRSRASRPSCGDDRLRITPRAAVLLSAAMLARFLAGTLLGLSIVAPPGPVIAVMATASARGRTRESIAMGLGAVTADAMWLILMLFGFVTILQHHLRVVGALGVLGGGILLWMSWTTLRSVGRGIGESTIRGSYRLGVATVATSPFSLAWWTASGPILIQSLGWPGITGLFVSIVVYIVVFTYGVRWIGARFKHTVLVLGWISAVILAVFGVYFGLAGVRLFTGRGV